MGKYGTCDQTISGRREARINKTREELPMANAENLHVDGVGLASETDKITQHVKRRMEKKQSHT
jgi:hypothetical protein